MTATTFVPTPALTPTAAEYAWAVRRTALHTARAVDRFAPIPGFICVALDLVPAPGAGVVVEFDCDHACIDGHANIDGARARSRRLETLPEAARWRAEFLTLLTRTAASVCGILGAPDAALVAHTARVVPVRFVYRQPERPRIVLPTYAA